MIDPSLSRKILDLCDETLALAPQEREAFLQTVAQRDSESVTAVRLLLQAIEDSGSFSTVKVLPAEE
jgi:hypothetical protein